MLTCLVFKKVHPTMGSEFLTTYHKVLQALEMKSHSLKYPSKIFCAHSFYSVDEFFACRVLTFHTVKYFYISCMLLYVFDMFTSNCLVTASGTMECMYVCVFFLFYFLFIKYAPSPRNDTYYNVTSYLFLVIGRGCRVCLFSRCRPLHFLYNV